jgi:hypothetical protein
MQVYNISFQIAPTLELQWLEWMKAKFIPMIVSTACFEENKLYQLEVDAEQAPTYTLQLFTRQAAQLANYLQQHDALILQELSATWGDQCFYFATKMKIVN